MFVDRRTGCSSCLDMFEISVDGILVYSRSEAELVKRFRVVFQTLRVELSGSSELKPYRIWWLG